MRTEIVVCGGSRPTAEPQSGKRVSAKISSEDVLRTVSRFKTIVYCRNGTSESQVCKRGNAAFLVFEQREGKCGETGSEGQLICPSEPCLVGSSSVLTRAQVIVPVARNGGPSGLSRRRERREARQQTSADVLLLLRARRWLP